MPLDIKIKALKEQISLHELVLILHNYLKHRGTLNTIDIDETELKDIEKLNQEYNNNLLPCENQLNWFNQTGKVLGNELNSVISNEDYQKEIRKILNHQNLIKDKKFIDDFIQLFQRYRHYSEGPGSFKSPTPYGRFRINEKTNKVEQIGKNLWDALIGKCTYYPNENRNYKKSPITEYFNLLNDFANLKFINNGIEDYLDVKTKILMLSQKQKNSLTYKSILKLAKIEENQVIGGIKGLQENKPKIEEMISTKNISKWLFENKIKEIDYANIDDILYLDNIFSFGVQKQNSKERKQFLIENKSNIFKNNENITNEMLEELANKKIWSSGTSSLSKKAQLEFINFAFTNESKGKNQMNYFQEKSDLSILDTFNFSKLKYFPENIFKDEIMSSTVKRTFNQAIKILNAILKNKKYRNYEISHVFVELAREMNSQDEKQKIDQELRKNKKYLEEQMKRYDVSEDMLKRGENRLKFLLWIQQNKQDIYDGEIINHADLLTNPQKYHIDHILPISKSFVDSMQNKVLTKASNNERKKDQTPYEWLSKEGKFEEYKKRCEKLLDEEQDKTRKAKLKNKINNYLLYQKSLSDELQGFVSRQLNDTRYITTLFDNQLKKFFRLSKYWKESKIVISSINGALTTFARKNWFSENDCDKKLLIKNRNVYNHHAIDASIIAFLGLNSNIQKLLKFKKKRIKVEKDDQGQTRYIDIDTGEISYESSNFMIQQSKDSKYFRDQMRNFLDKDIETNFVRFSRMINKKTNLALSNETLYSLREYDNKKYKITTLKLLEKEAKDLAKFFGDKAELKSQSKLVIFENEKYLYDLLNKIFIENYDEKINPFRKYLNNEFVKDKLEELKNDSTKLDKIPIFLSNNSINWIRELKMKENEIKDVEEILTLKNHNHKAFYDSLKPQGVRVYKNRKGKYQTIFINALVLKYQDNKLVVDESKINKLLEKNDIEIGSKFLEINKGKSLIFNNEIYYFNGGGHRKLNLLEIAIVSMKNELANQFSNWEMAPNRNQWQISVSTIARDFKLCKVDPLGNVYNIFTFDEYFENDMLKY